MFERDASEATAFALERRNFDYLPDEQASQWRRTFLRASAKTIAGPRKLIVEILNSCNLDCPMCRVGQHGINLDRAMPLDIFVRAVAAVPTARTVRLNGLGESTLLPNFCDYLTVLLSKALRIELITNGSGPLQYYETILNSGGHIFVSWDAADAVVFERLRRPAKWSQYLDRLGQIATMGSRSIAGSASLIFTLQKANIGHVTGVVELASQLGLKSVQVNVIKSPALQWAIVGFDKIVEELIAAQMRAREVGILLLVPDQILGKPVGVLGPARTAGSLCSAPWDEVVVRWNGDVQACNMFNPFVYGNIHRTSFDEIWQNRFAATFRAELNGANCHPYCKNCAYMPDAYDQ